MIRVMITGRRGRGKDTLADILRELVPSMERHAFADPLKDQVAAIVDRAARANGVIYPRITRQYTDEHRDQFGPLWQWYGTDFVRAADPNYWVRTFNHLYGHIENLVVPDYRFGNEGEWGLKHGFVLVRVMGPNRRPDADKRDDNHPSEANTDTLPVNIEFFNDGPVERMREWVKRTLLPTVGLLR